MAAVKLGASSFLDISTYFQPKNACKSLSFIAFPPRNLKEFSKMDDKSSGSDDSQIVDNVSASRNLDAEDDSKLGLTVKFKKLDEFPSYQSSSPIGCTPMFEDMSSFWDTDDDSYLKQFMKLKELDESLLYQSPSPILDHKANVIIINSFRDTYDENKKFDSKIVAVLSKYDTICRQYSKCCRIEMQKRKEIDEDMMRSSEDLDLTSNRLFKAEYNASQKRSTLRSEMNTLMVELASCYYPFMSRYYSDCQIRLKGIALENLEQISEECKNVNSITSCSPSTFDSKGKLLSVQNSEGAAKMKNSSSIILNQLVNSEVTTPAKKLGSRKLRSSSEPPSQPASDNSSNRNGRSSFSSTMKFVISYFFIALIAGVGGSSLSSRDGIGGRGFNGRGGEGGGGGSGSYVPQLSHKPFDAKIYKFCWISVRVGSEETRRIELYPESEFTKAELNKEAARLTEVARLTYHYLNEYARNGYEEKLNLDGIIEVTILLTKLNKQQPHDVNTERGIVSRNQPSTIMGYLALVCAEALVTRTSSIEAEIRIETTKHADGTSFRRVEVHPRVYFRHRR